MATLLVINFAQIINLLWSGRFRDGHFFAIQVNVLIFIHTIRAMGLFSSKMWSRNRYGSACKFVGKYTQ